MRGFWHIDISEQLAVDLVADLGTTLQPKLAYGALRSMPAVEAAPAGPNASVPASTMSEMTPPVAGPNFTEKPEPEPIPQVTPSAPAPSAPPLSAAAHPPRSTPVSETPSGEHFLAWLIHAVQSHKLVINDAKALVHTVADTVYLVSPGIFQRYAQEHLRVAALAKEAQLNNWQWVQKQFEKLQIHRKQADGLNIWTCNVTGPRKTRRLHGYLLSDPTGLFAEQPLNNPYLELITTEP